MAITRGKRRTLGGTRFHRRAFGRRHRAWRIAAAVALVAGSLAAPGCAITYTYRDAETGAVHVWGFGHVAIRATAPAGGKKAVVQSVETFGASTGVWGDLLYFTLGSDSRQVVEIVDENTAVSISTLAGDLLTVGFGGEPDPDETKKEDP